MDGKLFWRTGKEGKLEDLAGLVCDKYGDEQCINELKGTAHGGQTWAEREAYVKGLADGQKATMNLYKDSGL